MSTVKNTVRDLRRIWKPTKLKLQNLQKGHPLAIRLHRAFSWMEQADEAAEIASHELQLLYRWIALNALYGVWDQQAREPKPDGESWRGFFDRVLRMDDDGYIGECLVTNRNLAMAILEDKYLSQHFWRELGAGSHQNHKAAKFKAQNWYFERRWTPILDNLIERIYLMRCQLIHGAATYGGKLNRTALRRCSLMLDHLLHATLLTVIQRGESCDWEGLCYPPVEHPLNQSAHSGPNHPR